MYAENYEKLKNQNLKNGSPSHRININSPILPFTTREPERVDFQNGFLPIIGALSRIVCNKDIQSIDNESILEKMFQNEDFEYEDDCKDVFVSIISKYLDNSSMEHIIHPKLLLFLALSNSEEKKGEIKTAQFLDQIFFKNVDFKSFFEDDASDKSNILVKFIIENLSDLNENNEAITQYVVPESLKNIISIFEEDFNFLLDNKAYLMSNLDLILAYYYFLYLTQFSLKSNSTAATTEMEEMYWLLDTESMSKKRRSIFQGYNKIDDSLKYLLANVNVLEQSNTLFGTRNLLSSDMVEKVNELPKHEKEDFLKYFRMWIAEWREANSLKEIDVYSKNIDELMKIFRETFRESIDEAPQSRFKEGIKKLGIKYFLKTRGRYGFMLNMNQELLMLLTVVSMKDKDRISLFDLFKEYERRGIFFDRDSQNEVIDIFNRLNLIDKKSDSGEVQYVKSIL